jgi:hypothetical protein
VLASKITSLSEEDIKDNSKILSILEEGEEQYGLPDDFLHLVALVGLFPPTRNCVKNWSTNEAVFVKLVKK